MGVVLAIKKKGEICIVSDSMTISGGSRKQNAEHIINCEKIIQWGSSYIGLASHPAWPLVLQSYISQVKHKAALNSRDKIFYELLKMHQVLKEKYHLSSCGDEGDSFESIGFESLIINAWGIFKTYELRSVQQFIRFAAVGSGAQYALGALHALYDRCDSAEEIAREALHAVVEFEDSSGLPGIFYTVKSK